MFLQLRVALRPELETSQLLRLALSSMWRGDDEGRKRGRRKGGGIGGNKKFDLSCRSLSFSCCMRSVSRFWRWPSRPWTACKVANFFSSSPSRPRWSAALCSSKARTYQCVCVCVFCYLPGVRTSNSALIWAASLAWRACSCQNQRGDCTFKRHTSQQRPRTSLIRCSSPCSRSRSKNRGKSKYGGFRVGSCLDAVAQTLGSRVPARLCCARPRPAPLQAGAWGKKR
jgi:hypothetical protein